jgi:hypothetical protein
MILLRIGLAVASLLATVSFGMAQTAGQDRALTDGGPPGFSQRYDRGANEIPSQNAPPVSEGRSAYAPGYGEETIAPSDNPNADMNGAGAGVGAPTGGGH